jgi:hypothetical protein
MYKKCKHNQSNNIPFSFFEYQNENNQNIKKMFGYIKKARLANICQAGFAKFPKLANP